MHEAEHPPDDGPPDLSTDSRYQQEREQRKAEALADIQAETGEAAVVY